MKSQALEYIRHRIHSRKSMIQFEEVQIKKEEKTKEKAKEKANVVNINSIRSKETVKTK